MSIDFYGNDISNVEDNCLEADGGAHNIRIFRNRCFNHGHRALSVQPIFGGRSTSSATSFITRLRAAR